MDLITILLGTVLVLNILLATAIIFLERRDVSSTWAWLMVLYFIPVFGFLLYLLLGRKLSKQKIFTWDKQIHVLLLEAVHTQKMELGNGALRKKDPLWQEYKELILMHLNNDQAVLAQKNQVEIFTDGREKFDALLKDLESAQHHIHLIYYIIRHDDLGKRLAEVLTRKAREGVQVRMIYDDLGSRRLSKKFIQQIREAGGEIEAFFPAVLPLINLRLNYRNHRKLVVIDGKTGYIGGFNIGNEYLGLNPRFGYWRDTHLRIQGDAVHQIQSRFILDWNQASHHDISYQDNYYPNPASAGEIGVQIVSSGPDSEWEQIKNGYIKMILSAKRYVYIQTPYFIPDHSLLDALRIACLSGIDVRIMIPNKPDHPFVYWATYSHVGDLLQAGGKIYIYENGFLHAKTIVVDGKIASVGSANIDMRSFRLNFEVNAFLYHAGIAQQLADIFQADMLQSTPLTWEDYLQRPYKIRFKESISRLLSPIL
ncbi:cardiolipin synthase [Desmospora profundinema]|uniref:Cardiolipin synthase n=1 Tax=Desmospora profundinema TaxID=1571184 RepID=A0ABU1IS21_9BACL|nr:cardiolipin synthase [Desmospora profundinema]MDR6227596.1 cardiolipin synthase [Desmospora profundinema]